MLGAILGDVAGSIYEHHNIRTKDFPLFKAGCRITDDTVLTVATMECLLKGGDYAKTYGAYYAEYPHAGYGASFRQWADSGSLQPYHSFGNGSAMRVSPVAWYFKNLEEVLAEAERSASVTHNHPEGIKGAQAAAAASFLVRQGNSRDVVRQYIEGTFGYDLSFTLASIRPRYTFDVSCQGSVPQAIVAWLESAGVEDAVRNAISIGGDSDTIACIAGFIAEAEFGMPKELRMKTFSYLDQPLGSIVRRFYGEVLGSEI